jgi:hypothetical protein
MSLQSTVSRLTAKVATKRDTLVDRLFSSELEPEPDFAPLIIDADAVLSVLDGRRQRKRRREFSGFRSPPGRF